MPNEEVQANQLFFVRADDVDGHNRDLLVVAARQSDTFGLWRKHYELDASDLPEWVRPVPGVTPNRAPGPIGWEEIEPD
jgi:hypothetical protein